MPKYDATEEQRRLAEQMADYEFENEIVAFMGDRAKPHIRDVNWNVEVDQGPLSPQEAHYRGFAGRYTPGRHVAEDTMDFREVGLLDEGEWLEDDTITLLPNTLTDDPAGLGVITQAHELEHYITDQEGLEQDFFNHLRIYARMGHRARTQTEWEDAVQTLEYFIRSSGMTGTEGTTPEEVMQTLISAYREDFLDEEREAEGRTIAAKNNDEEGLLMQGGNPLPYYVEGEE